MGWDGALEHDERSFARALSGQMIVFETIFSVIYSLIYKQQAPKWTLVVGVFFTSRGVLLSLKVFRDSGRKVSQPN